MRFPFPEVEPKRTILKRRIIPFFVETFCDGNHPNHNRPCAMRVLHEIDCPHHRVAVRFSREEFYLCNHNSSRGMDSFQGMLWVLMKRVGSDYTNNTYIKRCNFI